MATIGVEWSEITRRLDGSAVVAANRYYSVERKEADGAFVERVPASSRYQEHSYNDEAPDPAAGTQVTYTYCVKVYEDNPGGTPYQPSVCGLASITLGSAVTVSPPDKPSVAGAPTATSITARGTAAATGGTPTEWRFRYKAMSATDWNDWTAYSTSSRAVFASLTPGTAYQIQAQAKNSAGESPVSDVVDVSTQSVATAPDTPTLSGLTATHDTVSATVSPGGGTASSFTVEISTHDWMTDGSAPAAAVVDRNTLGPDAGATSFSGREAGTRYYLRAQATNSAGSSDWSASQNIETEAEPTVDFKLPEDANIQTGAGAQPVHITEVSPADAELVRTPAPAGAAVTAGIVEADPNDEAGRIIRFTGVRDGYQSFTVTGLKDGYRRRQRTIRVESRTPRIPACDPASLKCNAGATSVTVTATAATGALCGEVTAFQYEIREGRSGLYLQQSTWNPPELAAVFRSLKSDTLYQIRARARSGVDRSLWSGFTDWEDCMTDNDCAGATLSVDFGSDQDQTATVRFSQGGTPDDLDLRVQQSNNVVPSAPTAESGHDQVVATIVSPPLADPPGSYKLRVRSSGTVASRITTTITVRVEGTCGTRSEAIVAVTLDPPASPCDGVGAPYNESISGDLNLTVGGSSVTLLARATPGIGSDSLEISAAVVAAFDSDGNAAMPAATSIVTVTEGPAAGATPLESSRGVTVAPVAEGSARIGFTFYSKVGTNQCRSITRRVTVRVAPAGGGGNGDPPNPGG